MMPSNYFQSHIDYFWYWEDEDQVIAIPDGSTIIYRAAFSALLKQLAAQGLPPLGSLLLSLVALNTRGREDLEFIKNKIKPSIECSDDAFAFLQNLSNIPDKYRRDKWKGNMLETIFNDCHTINSISKSKSIIKHYEFKTHAELNTNKSVLYEQQIRRDLRPLALFHRAMPSSADIISCLENVPGVEEEILLERRNQPTSEEEPDLIEQLIDNPTTSKVGSLVKVIWSGLNLPFHSSTPSQQPMGGVSDLTNKGNYDQLLISEYANEDLIFLSRLANNEALFLSRESPPQHQDMKRVILIDATIKTWGTPKIMAFATMLAICKHPKTDINCDVYVVGSGYTAVGHSSVHEIIEGLQIAEAAIDCSEGIRAFLIQENDAKKDELFIITEKSTLDYDGMRFALNEFSDVIDYLIHTDNQGHIDIFKNRKSGKKHVQHLEIPLQRLWKNKQPKRKITPRVDDEYYPLLVRMSQSMIGMVCTEHGEIFQLNKEKTLLRLHRFSDKTERRGWEIVGENIRVINKDFEIGTMYNGDVIVLLFNRQHKEITLINLNSKNEIKTYFNQWRHRANTSFVFHNQKFYHGDKRIAWSIDAKGQIKEESIDVNALTYSKNNRTQDARSQNSNYLGNFKNVKRIGITDTGELLFNVHKLELNHRDHIQLVSHHNVKVRISATLNSPNRFLFSDGSLVTVNRSGFLSLRSSDESIPTIYIPLVLNHTLGVATNTMFAGNQYYHNEPMYNIMLHNPGPAVLKTVKEVKNLTGFGLKVAKDIVDGWPGSLVRRFTRKQADEAIVALTAISCEVEIVPENAVMQPLNEIHESDFYDRYIKQFIKTIENHHFGTKTKN